MEVSPTHARGLRKEVFGALVHLLTFGFHGGGGLKEFLSALALTKLPMRTPRMRREAFDRIRRRLREVSLSFSYSGRTPRMVSGTVMLPGDDQHMDGGSERVIRLAQYVVIENSDSLDIKELVSATISQHAIERMFQRLRTSDMSKILVELSSVCELAAFLTVLPQKASVRLPSQLLIPTKNGALLCRTIDGGINGRTFVSVGEMSDRLETSRIATKAAFDTAYADPSAAGQLLGRLFSDPRNWWWDQRD